MIKICHLYYDILNLYGESGNILALKKAIENQHCECSIYYKTIGDKIDFNTYDIIYLGSGSEDNLILVLNDLIKYQEEIKKYYQANKIIIATGNSNAFFGSEYNSLNKNTYKTLNLFSYTTYETPFRTVGEQIYRAKFIHHPIIGFLNHQITFKNYDSNFFKVISGNGYAPKINDEGLYSKNFYGTLLIGPLLIRNPFLVNYIIKKLFTKLGLPYTPVKDTTDILAYHEYLKNFVNN